MNEGPAVVTRPRASGTSASIDGARLPPADRPVPPPFGGDLAAGQRVPSPVNFPSDRDVSDIGATKMRRFMMEHGWHPVVAKAISERWPDPEQRHQAEKMIRNSIIADAREHAKTKGGNITVADLREAGERVWKRMQDPANPFGASDRAVMKHAQQKAGAVLVEEPQARANDQARPDAKGGFFEDLGPEERRARIHDVLTAAMKDVGQYKEAAHIIARLTPEEKKDFGQVIERLKKQATDSWTDYKGAAHIPESLFGSSNEYEADKPEKGMGQVQIRMKLSELEKNEKRTEEQFRAAVRENIGEFNTLMGDLRESSPETRSKAIAGIKDFLNPYGSRGHSVDGIVALAYKDDIWALGCACDPNFNAR